MTFFEDVFERAKASLISEKELEQRTGFDGLPMRQLFSLCRELQRSAGPSPFSLSCATTEKLIDVTRIRSGRYLNALVVLGVLSVVEKGSPQTRRATRYHFLLPIPVAKEGK